MALDVSGASAADREAVAGADCGGGKLTLHVELLTRFVPKIVTVVVPALGL
jgi:hypothetical protein